MKKVRILFIHHSTGSSLITFGKLRKLLKEKAPNIELWDHGYNLYSSKILSKIFGPLMFRTGLSDRNGKMTGTDFNINISNNSPKEYAEIFSREPTDFTLKNILLFDIVIFTPPPLRAETTKPEWAKNARILSAFINKEVKKYNNITVFDFFDLLADKEGENKNMLKRKYCNFFIPIDSHPNIRANREVGKKFVEFLIS